jgi:hypothetical protein
LKQLVELQLHYKKKVNEKFYKYYKRHLEDRGT